MSADYESSDYVLRSRKVRDKPSLWDSFQDPPAKRSSGSDADWKKLQFFIKLFKLFTYIFVCAVVLASSVAAKLTYLYMAGNTNGDAQVRVCSKYLLLDGQVMAMPSKLEQIAWVWALIFAFAAPELFTFLRAMRISMFKREQRPNGLEVVLVTLFELLHVVGLALLTFTVLPQLDMTRGAMLGCCVCFVPALLNLLTGTRLHWKSGDIVVYGASIVAALSLGSVFLIWPAMSTQLELQLLAIPLILVSFRWWENFANKHAAIAYIIRTIRCTRSRYHTYLYLAPLKIVVFGLMGFLLHGESFIEYFTLFFKAWQAHAITLTHWDGLQDTVNLAHASNNGSSLIKSSPRAQYTLQSNSRAVIYAVLLQVGAAYLCHIFGKFACKIKIQHFSYALPLSLATPVTVAVATILAQMRASNICWLHGLIPDYLTLQALGENLEELGTRSLEYALWLWPLWLLAQIWTCLHIWRPRNDRNAPTEKLYVCPWYCGLLVDQCSIMNRRILDWSDEYFAIKSDLTEPRDPVLALASDINASRDIQEADKIPQLIVCATMWHETEDEMMEFLKSIVRLDEDQCARRMAKTHLNGGKADDEYYELETNIFFDDAFVLDEQHCKNKRNPPLNEYVKTLTRTIDKAAFEIYGVIIKIKPPLKIETPYGGRLVWTLPGRTKMVAHLKNKDKVRHKKRWSQVMYMYYLLGFRIMETEQLSARRKAVIAENTFLLALDGDIDFQPRAVQLLIDRMKAIDELGAACGRIHPVGRGPMVWYQKFEYAIGHWLQKATEHVIGCVLCSPGCFSLFRASALMENSVMKRYTLVSSEAMKMVQYDQGEDRWLCTLLLKQGSRVEYCAASDAFTHSPEYFNEFYNQRRRWVPSTIANIFDILGDARTVVKKNNSISTLYIMYQAMLMIGTVLGPGTIFLMMVGALVAVFSINIWTAFLWNFFPILLFILSCVYLKQKFQLLIAFVVSALYCLVMMAVLIGIIVQMLEDGPLAPASLFFLLVAVQITISALMHPQEFMALFCGVIYYITIPSMYMLLMIFSVFNMNDVTWGTREAPVLKDADDESNENDHDNYLPGWLNDPLLIESELGEISLLEQRFWKDMIRQYLKPLELSKEQKQTMADDLSELRNMVAFAFVMVNAIFVLIVFLLQLKKEFLHLKWPIDPTDFVSFDRDNLQVGIYRQYKELDPIGLCFVIFFGFILVIQFIAMFFHRFGTMSQLLAATQLDWFRSNGQLSDEDAALELNGNAVHIARRLQRPRRLFDDDDDDDEDGHHHYDELELGQERESMVRRQTIFRLHEERNKEHSDYSDLVRNFEKRFFSEDDLNMKNLHLSRKSIKLFQERRSVAKVNAAATPSGTPTPKRGKRPPLAPLNAKKVSFSNTTMQMYNNGGYETSEF
ncbi:chitin synthase chs-2 [Drosophila grimshawi]|uniref:chitin synthase n=1 Tax=Drosophila grimshawi TaxID=7222 RepID=B4J0Q5_DROGR|nr:chitin synthase chs-2 [Drosophila grimshawi]EDV97910.1 GH14435 [Drosophila grimshawi]